MPTPPRTSTIDCHIDIPWVMTKHWFDLSLNNHGQKSMTDIPRMVQAGLDAAVFALYLSDGMQDEVGPDQSKRLIQRQIDSIPIQTDVQILLGLEGGRLIQEDLGLLQSYRDQGVKYLTVTHNRNTSWAGSATDTPKPLTHFGRQVINRCLDLGITPDISHTSDATAKAILEESEVPVIASHSGCRRILPNPRNISDDLIESVAWHKGVVHVPFARRMIGPKYTDFVKHIDHIIQLVGEDYVGIGSDLDGAVMAEGTDDVLFWGVIPQLLEHYSSKTIAKIMGGNTRRVLFNEPIL